MKWSCVVATTADPSRDHTHINVPNQCELYVKDNPLCLLTFGRQIEGRLTIHGVPLQSNWT